MSKRILYGPSGLALIATLLVASCVQPKVLGPAPPAAVASQGWSESGRRVLSPTYRIDFIDQSGRQATYWLGLNADLGIFPCYAICSGWWLAPSGAAGRIDSSWYKGLTSTMSLYLFKDLGF